MCFQQEFLLAPVLIEIPDVDVVSLLEEGDSSCEAGVGRSHLFGGLLVHRAAEEERRIVHIDLKSIFVVLVQVVYL